MRVSFVLQLVDFSMFHRSNAFANESLKTFKQKKEKERKALEASGNTQAWNSLFMRPDTVCLKPLLNWVAYGLFHKCPLKK